MVASFLYTEKVKVRFFYSVSLMEIKTKFNVGDYIYVVINNRVYHQNINSIEISINSYKDISIHYRTGLSDASAGILHNENLVFSTKQELLASL